MPSTSLVLTAAQRTDLEARVRSGRGRADAARRARVILLLADGCSYARIAAMTGCSSRTIALWKRRFRPLDRQVFAVQPDADDEADETDESYWTAP